MQKFGHRIDGQVLNLMAVLHMLHTRDGHAISCNYVFVAVVGFVLFFITFLAIYNARVFLKGI